MRSNRSNRTRSHPGCQVASTALTALTDWPISVLSGSVGHSTWASPGMTWRQRPGNIFHEAPGIALVSREALVHGIWWNTSWYIMIQRVFWPQRHCALRTENRFCQVSDGFKGCFGQVGRVFIHWSLGTWAIRAGWSNITLKSIDFSSWIKSQFWFRACPWCALVMSPWRFWTFENIKISWSLKTYLKHPQDSAESHSLDSLGLGHSGNSLRKFWGHPEVLVTFSEILWDPDAKDSAQRHSELFRVGRTGPGVGQSRADHQGFMATCCDPQRRENKRFGTWWTCLECKKTCSHCLPHDFQLCI